MEVAVKMTVEEFLEFSEYQKNRAVHAERLVELGRLTEVLAKKLEFAVEPDPKKPGEFKITDQERMANLWNMAGEILDKK